MKNVLNIANHNIKSFFNSPFSIMLLVMPIFATILLMMMLSSEQFSAGAQIGIVMPKNVAGAEEFLNELKKDLDILYLDEETALTRLEQKNLNGIIIIHTNNLIQDLIAGKKSLEVIGVSNDKVIQFITARLDAALSTVNTFVNLSDGDEKAFKKLYADYRNQIKEVKVDNADFEINKSKMIFGMFVMIFLFTSIKGLQTMMKEKESKIYERICASPVKRYEYSLGHILGAFSILMLQIIVQGAIMNKLGLTFGLGLLDFIGICMVLGIVGISLSLIILACTQNTQGYFIIGSFVISPLCMLSDCIFPKEFLPSAVNKVALLSPVRWVMALYKAMISGGELEEIIVSILIALGISVVLILMGMIIENSKKVI